MAKTKEDRLIFTKEMRKNYKILLPTMLPIHFRLIEKIMKIHGYDVELLENINSNIQNEGLKSVHNDTCFPALLVIGQMLDAIKSGKYDTDKIAVMITQTGGGCRASNYIHLLRKALKQNGLGHIPVISLNISGLESNPGFKIGLRMLVEITYSILYGDLLMWLSNQCRPYEVNKGDTDALVVKWEEQLSTEYNKAINLTLKKVKSNLEKIVIDFTKIKRNNRKKVRVGVVGEIYVKFAPLGNNNLEAFLQKEDCEVVVPGLMDFAIFKTDNRLEDIKLYGGKLAKKIVVDLLKRFLIAMQDNIKKAIDDNSDFMSVTRFEDLKLLVKDYVGYGNKMGEGWLLTGEMLELCHTGVNNIVCTQPFGCLPNHISGKGMIRKIKENNPESNIVAIDYDPGSSRVNQENRIKLMLANAKVSNNKGKK